MGAGIIPAYAGSTTASDMRDMIDPDHPRIRGEHYSVPRRSTPCFGSSPHTRGALARRPLVLEAGGIIPAYAGSTGRCRSHRRRPWDHPRIRGEHKFRSPYYNAARGSSPHTRGAPPVEQVNPEQLRIIPAYAGSTQALHGERRPRRDHPRIRGEHAGAARAGNVLAGSSPHTRGALSALRSAIEDARIIPAYAGSTAPRRLDMHVRQRIIPAYAGSTPPRRPPT